MSCSGVSGVAYLQRSVPEIAKNYEVLAKIGEGLLYVFVKQQLLLYGHGWIEINHFLGRMSIGREGSLGFPTSR